MTLKYLLDTNVISEPLRPRPNQKILEQIQQHQGEFAIASIVWHELWFGCHRLPDSKRRTVIESYLSEVVVPNIPVLAYDDRAAKWHAIERARLTSIGQTPSFADGQIVAIAYTNKLTVVTQNASDFSTFQDIEVVNWAEL